MLFARHLAWLRSRAGDEKKTRIELRQDNGISVTTPPIDGLEYIIELWNDAGTAEQGMSGLVPLSSRELRAWRHETEIVLSVFERSMILKMSRQYCYQSALSGNAQCEAPYRPKAAAAEDLAIRRTVLENKMGELF